LSIQGSPPAQGESESRAYDAAYDVSELAYVVPCKESVKHLPSQKQDGHQDEGERNLSLAQTRDG
jgi:hypothetical protein